jgi:uncharacterized membrane protein HdeD (DUF308 family)
MESKVQVVIEEFPKKWKWLLFLGIMNIVFGTLGVVYAEFVTITTTILFGVLMFVAGVVQLYHWFKEKEVTWSGRIPHLIFALLYIIGGAIAFFNPFTGASALTIVLASIFIVIGSLRIGLALFLAKHGWRWFYHALMGVLAIFLGIYIIFQWPISSLWVIGLLVSIELILNGWQMIWVALMARKLVKELSK